MGKLTNERRDIITHNAVEGSPAKAEYNKLYDAFCELVRRKFKCQWSEQEHLDMKRLPSDFFPTETGVRLRIRGFNAGTYTFKRVERTPQKYSSKFNHPTFHTDDEELLKAHSKLHAADEKVKETRREIKTFLASVSTEKRLRDNWPEGKAFYEQVLESTTALVVQSTENLNKLMGLKNVETTKKSDSSQ